MTCALKCTKSFFSSKYINATYDDLKINAQAAKEPKKLNIYSTFACGKFCKSQRKVRYEAMSNLFEISIAQNTYV